MSNPAPEPAQSRAYMSRVVVGAYYTNGRRLAEVTGIEPLGYVYLRNVADDSTFGAGIDVFRRKWWLVKEPV